MRVHQKAGPRNHQDAWGAAGLRPARTIAGAPKQVFLLGVDPGGFGNPLRVPITVSA